MIGQPHYEGLLDDAEREAGGVINAAGRAAGQVANTAQQVQQTANQVQSAGPGSGQSQQDAVAAASPGGFPWAAAGIGALLLGGGLVYLKRRK